MKAKKGVSLLLASVFLLSGLVSATSCELIDQWFGKKPEPELKVTESYTAYGNKTVTGVVKNPTKTVAIKLIRGKNVLAEGEGKLSYNKSLQAGDVIEIESDYCYLEVELFDNLGSQIVYSPSGQFTFQIPSTASQGTYESGTFGGTNHTFTAKVASDNALKKERNLALNPYDYMYVDEKNDQNAATMSESLLESAAVEAGEVSVYPHAYANRVTRNEIGFYARNAIDGRTESGGHGNAYPSWGYDQKSDAEYVVYFGREVMLRSLSFVLRADYSVSGGKEHDTYWQEATVEFSNGSSEVFRFKKTGAEQEFSLKKEVKTESVRIKNIISVNNAQSEGFAALTELEVYGKEKTEGNQAATKTLITPSFGGKQTGKFKTKDFSCDEIKETMDKANSWFINETESKNYTQPDYNGNPMEVKVNDSGWKDAVYYSGLNEAFFVTGDMNSYYFLRAVGDQFGYLNNKGKHTPHGDHYQIGETYLQLNDLRNTNYKVKDTLANAEYNLSRNVNDSKAPSGLGLDTSRDWSHMSFWWCDALYMAMNTYTLLSRQTGDGKYVKAAYAGYQHWKGVLYNQQYHLWHRDSTQFNVYTNLLDENGKKVPTFWSRGNAWVLAALAKQLMYLDENEYPEIYATYKADFIELAESIAQYQRDDGTWNASIIKDDSYYAGKEVTGTCGFVYAYCVGMDLGILSSKKYYPIVEEAYNCVVGECMYESGQVGYMQTTGYQPQNYRSEDYSKQITHEFGMGLFLLACSGMMRICSDYTAPNVYIPADPQAALLG